MKAWIAILVLLALACIATFGWQALALDPGTVLLRYGHTTMQTTLVFAIAALLLCWGVLSVLARLLRWPWRAIRQRNRRRSRERFAAGLTALAEGDHRRALRALERAAHHPELQAPALLATARAAQARGETERAEAALLAASATAPSATLALRARFMLEHGNAEAAVALLEPASRTQALPPVGWRLLAEAALLCGDAPLALRAVDQLATGDSLTRQALAALRARALTAAIAAAPDAAALDTLWSQLPRSHRGMVEAVAAYARRAAQLGQMLAAMDALETALRREWSERLAQAWGELGPADAPARLQRAESWLAAHPASPALLLALGRLCMACDLWGKAREYLERGLLHAPSARLWEALGDCLQAQKMPADAALCYRNALRCARGEATQALAEPLRAPLDTRASIGEERSEHGVPRLSLASESTRKPR